LGLPESRHSKEKVTPSSKEGGGKLNAVGLEGVSMLEEQCRKIFDAQLMCEPALPLSASDFPSKIGDHLDGRRKLKGGGRDPGSVIIEFS